MLQLGISDIARHVILLSMPQCLILAPLKVAVQVINIQHPRNVRFSNNFSDLHNSMGEIIHEASVAVISTVEQ